MTSFAFTNSQLGATVSVNNNALYTDVSGIIFSDNSQLFSATGLARSGNNISVFINDSGYIQNLFQDLIPKLGASLNLNSYNITGIGNININGNVSANTGSYASLNINSTGVSISGHKHLSTDITDFNEAVDDRVGNGLLIAGTGIELKYNDITNNLSIDITNSPRIVTVALNKTGSTIPKFRAVYINGGQGDQATITLAANTGEAESSKTYGVTAQSIDHMSTGDIIVFGSLTGVNTDQFNPTAPVGDVNGTTLYLGSSSGLITSIKPYAPNNLVSIGTIVRTHQNEGIVEIRIQNGFELEELHNVSISGVINNQIIKYDSSVNLWKNNTLVSSDISNFNSSVSGILPVKNIIAGTGISLSVSDGSYTINSTSTGGGGGSSYTAGSGLILVGDQFNIYGGTGHFAQLSINGFTFPVSDGSANQYLKTNGAGSVSWSSVAGAGSGTELSVTGSVSLSSASITGVGTVTVTLEGSTIKISGSSSGQGGGSGTTVSNYADNRIITSDGTSTGLNAESNLTFDGTSLAVNGLITANSGNFASGLVLNNQTASTIASFDSNKNIVSLSTTTYPSLTELSYVKGVTSAIQTQLNSKASSSHTHTSTDITNFNSAVSGLLNVTNIVAGTGISVSSSNGVFTINATSTGGGGAGGISNLIEDTTPQLGGNLDLNGYSITGNKFQTTSSGTIIGHSGWIYQNNQNVISNGSFGIASGDAQYSTYLLRTTSTNASWNTLLNDGKSGILLASNRTFQFSVNIVARRTDAKDNAAYKLEGFLSNDGFGCDIIGTPTKTVFGESDSSWDVQATISNSGNSNYLFIQGYGASNKTINWLAKVDILEIGGNIPSYTESNILNIPNFFIP